MIGFPLGLGDVSLLFAFVCVTLFITLELLYSSDKKRRMKMNGNRLRNSAYVFLLLFIITLAIRIVLILSSP